MKATCNWELFDCYLQSTYTFMTDAIHMLLDHRLQAMWKVAWGWGWNHAMYLIQAYTSVLTVWLLWLWLS